MSAAFSLAAAAFFPALVLGIFWKRANKWGATLGMIGGPRHHVLLHGDDAAVAAQRVRRDRARSPTTRGGASQAISAGLWGVPLGFVVIIVVSLLTPAPDRETQELVEHVRYPNLAGDTMDTRGT